MNPQFQPYLDRVNDEALKLPPKVGLTLSEFVEEWRRDVAVNLRGSTTRAAESHLRAHIIPKLGSLHLTQITTKTVQRFVAYLASGGRSRKTVVESGRHLIELTPSGRLHILPFRGSILNF
jgi:hypothetical protein